MWRHTRKGDKYVTVIIDLTPVRTSTGPARLLDMVEGRSKQAFKTWLEARPADWKATVEVVAMDGFTGFKTAAAEAVPGPGRWVRETGAACRGGQGARLCRYPLLTCTPETPSRGGATQSRSTIPSGAPYLWVDYTAGADRVFENELDGCLQSRCATQQQYDFARGEIDALRQLASQGRLLAPAALATPVHLDPALWELRFDVDEHDKLRLYHGEPTRQPRTLLALKAHWKWLGDGSASHQAIQMAQDRQMAEAADRYRRTGLHPAESASASGA